MAVRTPEADTADIAAQKSVVIQPSHSIEAAGNAEVLLPSARFAVGIGLCAVRSGHWAVGIGL